MSVTIFTRKERYLVFIDHIECKLLLLLKHLCYVVQTAGVERKVGCRQGSGRITEKVDKVWLRIVRSGSNQRVKLSIQTPDINLSLMLKVYLFDPT